MVRDGGTPSKRSLARVLIIIGDHNDHPPVFLWDDLEGRVFETAAVGTAVLQVKAVDKDVGPNAELQYSILSGMFLFGYIELHFICWHIRCCRFSEVHFVKIIDTPRSVTVEIDTY